MTIQRKPFDAAPASHLHVKSPPVTPSRLQVARQSYILEVSHIHIQLCDWRRSLCVSSLHRAVKSARGRHRGSGDILVLSVDVVVVVWVCCRYFASQRPEVASIPVNTSRLRKSFTHLSEFAAYCRRFCVFYVAVMYSTWPRFVFRWRCGQCLRDCGPRSAKMSSCRAADALLTRNVGVALLCLVCLYGVHRFALRRRSLVSNKYLILGYTQEAHIAAANDETKPLMLGSVSFGNSTFQNCCKLWMFVLMFGADAGWYRMNDSLWY